MLKNSIRGHKVVEQKNLSFSTCILPPDMYLIVALSNAVFQNGFGASWSNLQRAYLILLKPKYMIQPN